MPLAVVSMLVLVLVMSWFPLGGPLIAGTVGGYMAGGIKRALLASLPAAALLGLWVSWAAPALFPHVIGGLVIAAGTLFGLVVNEIGLLLGTVLGGFIVVKRRTEDKTEEPD